MNKKENYFRRAPIGITDYKKVQLHEGDIMKHPNEDDIGVIRYEKNACQFRIQYDPKKFIPSCHVGLQTGKKGKCIKIGSVYEDSKLLGWEEKTNNE
jgi:hypothetical protein